MKIKFVIIEDEPLAAERLEDSINKLRPDWQCLAIIQSVREAKKRLAALDAQLLFLDVHLADDISFSIFEELQLKTPVIFTTAYDQYALKAFQLNSIDYLLKPISNTALEQSLVKFEENRLTTPDLARLAQDYSPVYKERFLVSTGNKVKSISTEQVAYFFANGKHSYLIDKTGTEYLFDKPLNKLIEELNPAQFFQVNRQYIFALSSITEMIPYSKGRYKILSQPTTEQDVMVSAEKSGAFKKWMGG
jgi:two-component system response regulator LytT